MHQPDSILLSEQRGAVLILSINNRAARNALHPDLYRALPQALLAAEANASVAAIILTGAGDFFCSGGDLQQLVKRRDLPLHQRREKIEGLHELIRAIRRCDKPVIAAVEGGAAGAGMSLALACDLLVASRTAFFSVAYVKVGLSPDGGVTRFLAEFLSRQVLLELSLSGERIGSERLFALGAVNRLSDAGAALNEALLLAEKLAQGPQRAMARIKQLAQHAYSADLEQQMAMEAQLMAEAQGDAEAAEGINAFLEKRPADFAALRGKFDLP